MTAWRVIDRVRNLFAQIAIRPIDDFAGTAPVGRIETALDRQDGTRWIPLDIEPVTTPSGVLAYVGLGKAANPAAAPMERYRVRIVDPDERGVYRPAYRFALDGLEFDVPPWNESQLPAFILDMPEPAFLWPGANYPFPGFVPILRGRTFDGAGAPLADARIATATDRVLSDERGAFSLPIRLTTPAPSILVIAEHARTGTSAMATIALPAGLETGIDLQLV